MPGEAKKPARKVTATANHAFAVRRRDPELVVPAALTPGDTKRLSDIDDQDTLRGHVSFALVYRGRVPCECDPVGVIRRALSEALVHYYPLAGRLREVEGRKLVVDCNGEGVLFVEADADVRLAELELRPPFPCIDQLFCDVEGSTGVLDCPLLLIQVTRMLCGGFVLALRLNHTICDAIGIAQFMNAVGELARSLPAPTVAPVWSRELLQARSPPMPSFPHREFDVLPPPGLLPPLPAGDMIMRSFSFGAADIAAIKKHLPPLLRDTATTFEALTACLWRSRTVALEVAPGEDVQLVFIANFRDFAELGMPAGYYGNACVPMMARADAAALRDGSIGDAVKMVQLAKAAVTAEYVRSTLDVLVLRGRPCLALQNNMFVVSDNRHAGFNRVDFGWGEPAYGGPADTIFGLGFLVAVKDRDGQDAVVAPIVLPRPAMELFASEVGKVCKA